MRKILFGCLRCPANIMGWGDSPYCGKGLLTQVPNGKCRGRQVISYPNFLPIFIQKRHQSILSKTKIWSWKHLDKRFHSLLLPQSKIHAFPGLWGSEVSGCVALLPRPLPPHPSLAPFIHWVLAKQMFACQILLLLFACWSNPLCPILTQKGFPFPFVKAEAGMLSPPWNTIVSTAGNHPSLPTPPTPFACTFSSPVFQLQEEPSLTSCGPWQPSAVQTLLPSRHPHSASVFVVATTADLSMWCSWDKVSILTGPSFLVSTIKLMLSKHFLKRR